MALYTVSSGSVINAQDVNQLVNRLQQGSGGTETQTVFVEMAPWDAGATVGQWMQTQSQGSTPVSVAYSGTSLAGVGSLSTQQLGTSGFFVSGAATGASNTARFSTTWTVQY